ncbi:MAG: hypothetical protein KJ592_01615, partial [Nanoarchaeota archaeon]|nr:hypothetical protein [Nanoarchaeota archaeon]
MNKPRYEPAKQMSIDSIGSKQMKKNVVIMGLIEKVIQTGGPTIFGLADGTGNLSLKGFVAPGERAHPNIDAGDYVEAEVNIDEFNGELEGNILKIIKKTG